MAVGIALLVPVALRSALERPYTCLLGHVVDLVQDHAQGIVIVAASLVAVVLLLIGARCYWESRESQ